MLVRLVTLCGVLAKSGERGWAPPKVGYNTSLTQRLASNQSDNWQGKGGDVMYGY